MRTAATITLLLITTISAHAGALRIDSIDVATDTARVDPIRLAIVGGASAGAFVVGHVVLNDLWWKGERSDFHVTWTKDWRYALGADKLGHAVMPMIGVDIYRQAFEWTGMRRRPALWTAGSLAWLYMTYIEVRDGFSAEWGFSWGDMAANTLGVGWRVAEEYAPALRHVRWKVSYWPSSVYRAGGYGSIVDDYESTFHWMSFDPEVLLPAAWREPWPDWLNIAVGHSVEGIGAYDGSGSHAIYLSLDLDTEGLPGDSSFLRWLKRTLNYYHLPAPAIKVTPDVVWYGLKF